VQPLSRSKRRFYLYGLAVLFFAAVPLVLLYATGYRYQGALGVVRTGGIFIAIPYSDASVSMDGEPVGTTGVLNHDFYIGDLTPGAYRLNVTREGSHAWERVLVVESNLVTTASAFLVPVEPLITRLTTATTTDEKSRTITVAEEKVYLDAFVDTATTTLSGAQEEEEGEGLFIEKGDLTLRWMREDAALPSRYCGRPSYCVEEISIERGPVVTTRASFYAGGILYRTREGGVFIAEPDVRPTPVSLALYPVRGADFVVLNGILIVKDGKTLYEISGL
jgi:hypothetical protein